jgi:hypothetical protein
MVFVWTSLGLPFSPVHTIRRTCILGCMQVICLQSWPVKNLVKNIYKTSLLCLVLYSFGIEGSPYFGISALPTCMIQWINKLCPNPEA